MAVDLSSPKSASHLGKAIGYYPGRKTLRWISLGLGILFILVGMGILLYGLWQTSLQLRNFGPAMIGEILFWPGMLACGALIFAGIFGLIAVRIEIKTLTIFQNGFVFRESGRIEIWGWEDVATITSRVTRNYQIGVYAGSKHTYILKNVDGVEMVLNDSIKRVQQAVQFLQKQTFAKRFDRVVQQIEAGKIVAFGQILLARGGVRVGDQAYHWNDLQQINMQNGVLYLRGVKNMSVKVGEIPNPDVLVTILLQNVQP